MKTAIVKHLTIKGSQPVRKFIVETAEDMQKLLDNSIITPMHTIGMKKLIDMGKTIVVNDMGGYCHVDGTWEIIKKQY